MQKAGNIFLESVIKRVGYYKELADKTFAQLSDADFYFQPGDESNSIAVIIQHMAGNMLSRWTDFLNSDGEKEWRNRDEEFEVKQQTREELIALWEKGWVCFLGSLKSLSEDDLLKTIYIRHEPVLVMDAINRQLSHYPYHAGQIVYLGRMIRKNSWIGLSVAKGASADFNSAMKQKHH